MRELNGADRYQLYIESPTHHQHTLKVVVIDRAGLRAPLTLDRLRQWVQDTFVSCPPLCWQLAAPPIGRPVWVDNPVFDLEYHVNREVVAAPGRRDELAALLGRLMDQKLDRSRPLWRLWLVDGLAGDQVALVFSLHHALSDGGGTVEILSQIFDAAPDARPWSGTAERPSAEPVPGAATLSGVAARGLATSWTKLPALIVRSAHSVRVNRAWRRTNPDAPPKPFHAPRTRFGHELTPHRVCVTASVDFADIADVRRAVGGTVNDVFLAIAGGAIVRYLERRGERPRRSLTAGVPVSVRLPGQTFGNQLGTWFVRLATEETDPVARLRTISRFTTAVRVLNAERRSERLQMDWMEHAAAFRAYVGLGTVATRRAGRPPYNVILSNVKGPPPLWFDGSPITEIQSYSQLAAGIGLNITAWTYNGKLTAGIVACPEHVPDLQDLADQLGPALAELHAAAEESFNHGAERRAATTIGVG